ncbi:tetratricopeptide repeat protein [Parabacteroides sp. GYB001]|uniref:type IX secretion system periplasmic lipoprotein PorW/SprE n=1 Tax=Parabacteroides leei TaxID=2939491 RepID=UPI002017EA78|nr:cell envelope integrity protein TolA [Parabacteroides leei]MCL3853203.1 tetratricopeptide repeat protein [Parabacteroides leei]
MKRGFYYIISIFVVLLLWSCSTKKNTKSSRFYHAFTSRYNIYFNGKTSFDESLLGMQTGYKESYSEMIHMYPISAQPKDKKETGGPFDRAIEKGNKAIKLHSIKAKPAKKPGWRNDPKQRAFQEQEEYNPFLKKCWLLIGQGQFYNADFLQASATFSYIARHYSQDEEMVAEARLWQARCYSEMEWFYEAEDILGKLNTNGIPKKNLKQYASVYADYLVKNKQFDDAIPYFKSAIKSEKNKRQRTRMKYLLGQIYAAQDQDGMAYKMFNEVARANPPYELEFAARIRQTEVFTGNNYQKVVKMLTRMAKSDKNKDYLDQVYYALGNIYLNREDTVNAIRNYELGIEKSTQNGLEKAICQIKLGDIYFTMRDYVKAQPCFSGALSGIQKEYKDFKRVSKLSAVLDELVVHVEAVHLQDSLQTLAKMPEPERLAVIDKIIEQVKKEEEEAKALAEKEAYLADQAAKGTGIDRPGTETGGIVLPTTSGGTSFYFYNPSTVSQGKAQFQRKWGRRALEDNWRRRKKEMSTFNDGPLEEDMAETDSGAVGADGLPLQTDSLEAGLPGVAADDPKSREYYLQQLPFTEEEVAASNIIIEDGLYNMAMIYKDKLEDLPLSIEAFEELERRFPDNSHRLESYYQVYLMALRTGNTALAAEYKTKMTNSFPDADYTIAIADPNYEYNIRMMDSVQDSIYQQTYSSYLASDTSAVRKNYRDVTAKYPLATLIPKFMFLDALTYVQAGDAEGFKAALKALVEKYPTADVTELAGEMLKGILRGRTLMQGSVTGMAWNLRFGLGEDGSLSAADSARTFTAEPNTSYRMILMYPNGSVDKNQLLFAVAAYNFANFMVKEFDLTFEEAGPMSMLNISGFNGINEILQYYKMIYGKDGYAQALDKNVAILPISDDNYETLMRGKTLEEYINFFEENYGEEVPELAARWKHRMEAEEEKTEEAAEEEQQPEEIRPEEETEEPVRREEILDTLSVQPVIPETVTTVTTVTPQDSVPAVQAPEEKELTLKEIEAIRKREAEEEAARKKVAREEFEAQQKAEKELQEQKAKERADELKKQQEEEKALLKAKADREKQLEQERKNKLKQAEADRKAKLKAREELRKQKEREYKERQKLKEKERKQKEKEYQEKLRAKEKARREAQKAKEAAARARKK